MPLTTVDKVAERLNVRVDILTIDAEGHDSLVLAGASEILKNVRYIEFEHHTIG